MNRNPNENEIKYIRDSLYRFNEEIVGSDGHEPINIVEYDGEGNIIGILSDIPSGNQKYLLIKPL